jgi:predicted small secreted protein
MPTMRSLRTSLTRVALIAFAVGSLALTACNTMDGAGKDIEKAGEKIQDAADKNN